MRLESLELRNIRSYTHEKIVFPEGTILLAGDIGSGKSTILLAIEFALFGIKRGELSGNALLRHGEREGTVQLTFSLHDKAITIVRGLKKTSTGVGQDAGYILIDGVKTELTAVELKAKILELLGYPEALITKSKGLIFRYTVYTPQEQMKQILHERPEERLETFRKLFGVDRYRQVRDNATLLGRDIRSKVEHLKGQAEDLDALKEQQTAFIGTLAQLKKQEAEQKETLEQLSAPLAEARKTIEEIEKRRFEIEDLKRKIAITRTKHEQLGKDKGELATEIKQIEEAIAQEKFLSRDELEKNERDLLESLAAARSERKDIQEKIEANTKNEAKVDYIISKTDELIATVASLDTCPTCKQEVGEDHKSMIRDAEKERIEKAREKLSLIGAMKQKLEKKREATEATIDQLQFRMTELATTKAKLGAHEERRRRLALKQKRNEVVLSEIEKHAQELHEHKTSLEKLAPPDEETFHKHKRNLQQLEEKSQEIAVGLARLQEQHAGIAKQLSVAEIQIKKKTDALKEATILVAQHNWLTKHFSNVMFTIEKHVLTSLYHQFNDAFKEWFDMLIEDETLSVRLDPDFSPLVEQNGYETTIDHLSGGERTSVALAYRLALNKVVNQAVSHLNTHDLLILDEPTDGFSSEQLDRVREVLDQLGLAQIVIVSHEQKMESFVDHIIRVVKNEHESKIFT